MEWPRLMWYFLQKSIIFLDLKAATLSIMSFFGHPNLDSILFSRNGMMTELVVCLEGKIISGCQNPFMIAEEGG